MGDNLAQRIACPLPGACLKGFPKQRLAGQIRQQFVNVVI